MILLQEKVLPGNLPLMEDFYTIQGEGYYQGSAAYFIRLGGCDVGCVWCDVKESWDADAHPLTSIEEIVTRAKASGTQIVVVTGGEPLMHDLAVLTESLRGNGLRTHIETSGVYPLNGSWDWICFSPKKFKTPHESVYLQANELKVIVYNKSDLQWGGDVAMHVGTGCELFFQPEWSRQSEMLPAIIGYIKQNPKWQVSLQTHKYMNIP